MPRQINILASDIVTVPTDFRFTVNIAVPEVAVSGYGGGPPNGSPFAQSLSFPSPVFFEPKDQLLVKKIWVKTAHGFRQGSGTGGVSLAYVQTGSSYSIPEISAGILIPDFCSPIDFPPDGILLNPANAGFLTADKFQIFLNAAGFNISMASVPAILNTLTFNLQVFLEILHTRQTTPTA